MGNSAANSTISAAGSSFATARRLSALAAAWTVAALLAGCGAQYRPVVSAINPVGPAGQPTKYAVAISSPSPTSPGLVTFVDVSGDTVLSTPSILSNPSYFVTDSSGSTGFTLNAAGTFEDFGLSNPTGLRSDEIFPTTLAAGAAPVSISVFSLANTGSTIFVPEAGLSQIAELSTSGTSLLQSISVAANPVYVVGSDSTQRVYAISQGTGAGPGQVAAIEASTSSISSIIPVGNTPVYGVMTPDDNRAFILNKGSGTVSVINVVSNALDTAVPSITIPNIVSGATTTAPNPVWADFSSINSEMVVLNQGDGVHDGSLSIISIPLCNAGTPVTNPLCNSANPVDAAGFGSIVGTVNVGVDPVMVSVLADGSRAYVANSGNAATGVEGSVSIVNLISGTLEATIPAVSSATAVDSTPGDVFGHPNSISATTGTPTGKVYITSPDSQYLTVLRTDEDAVQTHISLQGMGVRVLVTQK